LINSNILPSGWCLSTVTDACIKVIDCHNKTAPYTSSGIKLLRTSNIRNGSINFDNIKYVDQPTYEFWSRRCPPEPGDILFTREAPMAEVGMIPLGETICMGQRMMLLRADNQNLLIKYLLYALQTPSIRKYADKVAVGAGVKHLRVKDVENLPILISPLNEQHRIVAKIEALKARSARVKESLSTILALLDQFRQSVLAAAFRGDLTAEWREQNPDVGPAEVLLEKIRAERRRKWEEAELAKMKASGKVPLFDKWKEKYKEPETIDDSQLPELPDGWCWAKFEDVATIASKLVQPSDYPDYPHIAPDNIEKGSGKLLEYKTIKEDAVTSAKHLFYPGQILYSKIRPYLSKCVLINFEGLCSADMYPIDSHVNTKFLFYYILSDAFVELIQKESGSRVVLPKANQQQVYAIPVPLPPLEEQIMIARKIDKLLIYKDSIKTIVSEHIKEINQLDQSILSQAFSGNLVPQDPNDEPASVLLERIRSEREKTLTPKTKRTKKTNPVSQPTQMELEL
jgi:type I restriction enzyme, S subunit